MTVLLVPVAEPQISAPVSLWIAIGSIAAALVAVLVWLVLTLVGRRRTEEELVRLKMAVEEAGHAVCITDPAGRIRYANRAFEQITGYSPHEAIGRTFRILKSGKHDEAFYQHMWSTILAGRRWSDDVVNRRKNGRLYVAHQSITPIRDSHGRTQWFMAIQTDISQRRAVEAALSESERQYRLLAEHATDMISRHSPEGTYLFASPASIHILGYHPDELVGKSAYELFHPDDLEEVKKSHSSVLGGTGVAIVQYRARRSDGSYLWCETTSKSVTNPMTGEVREIIAITRDIGERKAMEESLRRAKAEAEAANRTKGEFLANVSHEIRTPINIITGFVDRLLVGETDGGRRRSLKAMQSAASALSELISDILDLSRIESGRLELTRRWFDLSAFASTIEDLFEPGVRSKGLRWESRVEEETPPYLFLDDSRLRQVVINLVGNAVKFTREGGIKVGYSCTSRSPASAETGIGRCDLGIRVTDTGIGIPSDKHGVIFEAFRQQDGDTARRYGGTGLGLPIARRLVEAMGGTLEVRSEPGVGSEFEVVIRDVAWGEEGRFLPDDEGRPDAFEDAGRSGPIPGTADVVRALDAATPEVRLKFHRDFADHWKRVRSSGLFDEIRDIGQRLGDFAAAEGLHELGTFASLLQEAAGSFDVSRVTAAMAAFGELLSRVDPGEDAT